MGESSAPSPVRNSHVLLSLGKVDRFVSPSRYLAERYAANGIPRDRIVVMRNGIDFERFTAVRRDHDVFTLGFLGYLGTHKGLDVLLRALSLIADSGRRPPPGGGRRGREKQPGSAVPTAPARATS